MSARGGTGRRLAVLLAIGACSSLAEPPAPPECINDADCADSFVCDQGDCLPGNEPAPRAHLGFDIRERAAGEIRFRVEIDGCDCTVREEAITHELAVRRSRISQLFQLSAELSEDTPLSARFELTQASRHAQIPSPQRSFVTHPTIDVDTQSTVDTLLRWPRYHPQDVDPPPEFVLWEIEPEAEAGLALRYLHVVPPETAPQECEIDSDCCEPARACDPSPNYCDQEAGQCTAIGSPLWVYRHFYEPECSRRLEGRVALFDLETLTHGEVIEGANVQLRYADGPDGRYGLEIFDGVSLENRPPQCDDDSDCSAPEQFCDLDSQQCLLTLGGRPADEGSTTEPNGEFGSPVYLYCDDAPNVPHQRSFEVTVTPPGARPSVNYVVEAEFTPGGDHRVPIDFCVPDWGPGAPLELAVGGEPRRLIDDEAGRYTCCDLGCLPATADDAMRPEDTIPIECDGRTSSGGVAPVRIQSDFVLDDLESWTDADCVALLPDAQGRLGALTRSADCSTPDTPCEVDNVALGRPDAPRRYDVRVESPVGSVLASGDFAFELNGAPPGVQTLSLAPRTLIKGYVDVASAICARREPGEGCAAREAIVMAERLRMEDEPDGAIPGPFFHTVSTFYDPVQQRDGAFVLPLDPGGVYVVTAMAPAGGEGGPSDFAVVDLRGEAKTEDEPAPLMFELQEGIIVTLALEQFDQRTSVIPIDRGSYLVEGHRLPHPGRLDTVDPFIDLNRLGECWTPDDEGPQACKIRRLIPPGSDLARSQRGLVRFTTRRSEQAGCPVNQCPTPQSTAP